MKKHSLANNPGQKGKKIVNGDLPEVDFNKFLVQGGDLTGAKRLSMAPIISPAVLRPGDTISGEVIGIRDSQNPTIKGKLLHMRATANNEEFLFPATTTVALALGGDENLEKWVGKKLAIQYSGEGKSTKRKGKTFHRLDVYDLSAGEPAPANGQGRVKKGK